MPTSMRIAIITATIALLAAAATVVIPNPGQ